MGSDVTPGSYNPPVNVKESPGGVGANVSGAPSVELTDAQARVVGHRGGPLLVVGGPGTGKTTALEARWRSLVDEGVRAEQILFLTFSRSVAGATRARLLSGLGRSSGELPVLSWFAFGLSLVESHFGRLGYSEPPFVLTAPEQWKAVREMLESEASAEPSDCRWPAFASLLGTRALADEVADFVVRCRQRLLDPEQVAALARKRGLEEWIEVAEFFGRYEDLLALRGALDYGGLLERAVELLDQDPDVRAEVRERHPFVLVDEAQELVPAEARLLELLCADGGDLVCAGDPGACTETFRGADPQSLDSLPERFPKMARVALGTTFRLGGDLLRAARSLMSGAGDTPADHWPEEAIPAEASGGLGTATSDAARHAPCLEIRRYARSVDEAEAVARELRRLHLVEGLTWDSMAVLVPNMRAMAPMLRHALDQAEVCYRVPAGELALTDEPAVACALEFLRLAVDPASEVENLPEVLTSPVAGLDAFDLRSLLRAVRTSGRSLAEVVEDPPESLHPKLRERLAEFRKLRKNVAAAASGGTADAAFWALWSGSRWAARLAAMAADPASSAHRDLDALAALSRTLSRFVERRPRAGIGVFLDALTEAEFGAESWDGGGGASGAAVELLSPHRAKGREFDVVILVGANEGVLPSGHRRRGLFDPWLLLKGFDPVAREHAAIEDDRRLFYLALTRARRRCLVTFNASASRGRPSRFLADLGVEIPEDPCAVPEEVLSFADAEARARRVLSDPSAPPGERLAGLWALPRIPGCDPRTWWWQRAWTPGLDLAPDGSLVTSYSRISAYEDCPLRYLYNTVLGLDPDPSYQMDLGKWIHKVFERLERNEIARTLEAMRAELDSLWRAEVFPTRAQEHRARRDAEEMIDRYWRIEANAGWKILRVEYPFAFELGPHRIRGKIDRVDRVGNGIRLIDYKTGRWAKTQEAAQEDLQLAVYHLAAGKDEKLSSDGPTKLMELVYPAKNEWRGQLCRRGQVPKKGHAEATEARLLGLIDGVIAERFAPSANADCRFCAFKILCPLWPQGQEAGL